MCQKFEREKKTGFEERLSPVNMVNGSWFVLGEHFVFMVAENCTDPGFLCFKGRMLEKKMTSCICTLFCNDQAVIKICTNMKILE